ncbi:hypothetical protein GCM10022381_16160 [Leifsonia kafniensis]|uniref:DUF559 domain-containing protein n=1 Tax=Leifsonia kafniensis TaxID=475957 RepID=A0ABP7KE95_9MICO
MVPADARGLRLPTDMRAPFVIAGAPRWRVSWTDDASNRTPPYVWRVSVIDALVHILNTHDRTTSIVCLDAALHNRDEDGAGILHTDLDHIFQLAPVRAQDWRADVDGRAGSGGETEFRLAAWAAGIPFVPQPAVVGVGHLDGQVGPSTFVEIDGAEWHDNWPAFKADCERDAKVAARSGRVLRFSYDLFRDKWELCERALRCALTDDYRRPPSRAFPEFPWRMSKPRR